MIKRKLLLKLMLFLLPFSFIHINSFFESNKTKTISLPILSVVNYTKGLMINENISIDFELEKEEERKKGFFSIAINDKLKIDIFTRNRFNQNIECDENHKKQIEIIYQYLWNNRIKYNINDNFFEKPLYISINHSDRSAEGPSSGIMYFLALYSLATGKIINQNITGTGAINNSYAITAIGSLKEKLKSIIEDLKKNKIFFDDILGTIKIKNNDNINLILIPEENLKIIAFHKIPKKYEEDKAIFSLLTKEYEESKALFSLIIDKGIRIIPVANLEECLDIDTNKFNTEKNKDLILKALDEYRNIKK